MHVFNYHILLCWILMTVISLFDVLVIVHSHRLSTSTPDSVPYELSARASICAGDFHTDLRVMAHCVCACVLHACLKSCMYICCMYAEYDFNLKLFHTSNDIDMPLLIAVCSVSPSPI